MSDTTKQKFGPYEGEVDAAFLEGDLGRRLADMPGWLATSENQPGSGRHRMVLAHALTPEGKIPLAVKAFGPQSLPKDMADRRGGTKAERSWRAARRLQAHGIGTPRPVGYLDRWLGNRLADSYYLSVFEPDLSDFRKELIYVFREAPRCNQLISLLASVSGTVKAMHEAGVLHRDLGNQNIQLRRSHDGTWTDVQFVDLNRCVVKDELDLRARARDISRIYLPSDLLRVFVEMYFAGPAPAIFLKWERFYRRAYFVHSRTRRYRHPFRARRETGEVPLNLAYPDERDIWIWDERTAQAINVVRRKQRNRLRSRRHTARIVGATVAALPGVRRHYRDLLETCYKAPVLLAGRIGMALAPGLDSEAKEMSLLQDLGPIPALLRFYHHEDVRQWTATAKLVQRLNEAGHEVAVAMVQDRSAVKNPESWASFLETVLGQIHEHVAWVEVGHAVNRAKWGVWDLAEYRRLMAPLRDMQEQYPKLRFMGPAAIDFEYPHVVAALRQLPSGLTLDALSHHLYVDRRGAPENRQGSYGALEKFALARAVARWARACEDRLVISEVNWPLVDGGVYSPIGSPYLYPGQLLAVPPSVTEDEYADYMVRYLVIGLCSGMVDRVYWWRLVARGYGLVDDGDPDAWRKRPAFEALRTLLELLHGSTFVEKRVDDGAEWFVFEQPNGRRDVLAYVQGDARKVTLPFSCSSVIDRDGAPLPATTGVMELSGRPVYLLDVS